MDPVVLEGASDRGAGDAGVLVAGRYRLLARVGAGGMASISRARDETLGREVAVKLLHPHLADDPAVQERFRAEARAAAALSSQNVVNVFDSGLSDGVPFIVMEYVDGPSLRDLLGARGRLSPAEALAVVAPVCAGLGRAHARGLVHRDVKPENVLVARDGTVKVADFGIARAAEAASTSSDSLFASVHYIAPELVAGGEATPASDQYAVGILLYELLTGRRPFTGDSPAAVALRHVQSDVGAPSDVVRGVSRALDAVVAQATARDPARRFPDLPALVDALRAAVPEGPAPLLHETAAVEGNGTLVLPRDALETASLAPDSRPRFSRGAWRPPRPARPSRARLLLAAVGALLALLTLGGWFTYDRVVAPARGVPPLAGLPREAAMTQLRELGLVATFDAPENSRTVPRDQVLESDPEAGATVRRGEQIRLTLSDGPAQVRMPPVVDLTREEALALLEGEQFGFSVRVDEGFDDVVPAGRVRAQLPGAGDGVLEGASVIVNVSLGIEQVTVPDLAGRSREQAERLLADARLAPAFTEEYSDAEPRPGYVVRQAVPPTTQVDKGSAVGVVLSAGPVTTTMPDVRNTQVGEAVRVLEELGLDVEVVEEDQPFFGPFALGPTGDVREQNPQPGTTVARGDEVQLLTFVPPGEGG